MAKSISLSRAKFMTQSRNHAVEDHGYFELIRFLATGNGDAEALDTLLANRHSFCRALREAFDERVRPVLETLVNVFGWDHVCADGRLVFARSGKSHTFYVSAVRQLQTRAQIEARRAALRAERLANSPKGVSGQKPNQHSKKAA